jgi:hypothetical protein
LGLKRHRLLGKLSCCREVGNANFKVLISPVVTVLIFVRAAVETDDLTAHPPFKFKLEFVVRAWLDDCVERHFDLLHFGYQLEVLRISKLFESNFLTCLQSNVTSMRTFVSGAVNLTSVMINS